MSTIKSSTTSTTAYSVVADTTGTLVFQTGATPTTAVTLDASQNMGLGVTPSAWGGAGVRAFQISGYGSLAGSVGSVDIYNNAYYDGSVFKYISSNPATRYSQNTSGSSHAWYNAASGTAGNAITFTQAMTLDASGNLSVGGTGVAARITTYKAGKATIAGVDTTSFATGVGATLDLGGNYRNTGDAQPFVRIAAEKTNSTDGNFAFDMGFYVTTNGGATMGTKAMTIDSSGSLQVGTTSANSARLSVFGGTGSLTTGIAVQNGGGSGNYFIQFFNSSGSGVGSISQNGASATAYNTSSDYRLKENIAPMTGALSIVQQLNPVTYNWKLDGSNGQGFIAHELQAVVPDAVTGEKDALNPDGSIKAQGIDTSFLVATLTAAIQEQQALITQLQADVAALKGNA